MRAFELPQWALGNLLHFRRKRLRTTLAKSPSAHMSAQVSGPFIGVLAAHVMFGLPIVQMSARTRHRVKVWAKMISSRTNFD